VAAMADILKEQGIRNVVAPMPGQTYQFEQGFQMIKFSR